MSTSAFAAATVGPAAAVAVVHRLIIPHPVYQEDDPFTQVFVCPLCCDLAVQDPSITHCQHIFCRECIASALNRQAVCPIDRGSLRLNQVSPISGPLKQIWQSIKVKCPKCTVWSGPLETYESHVKNCRQWDEEQIKKLQDEVASANRVNRMLTKDLSTVQETLKQTLKQKKQLEKKLADVTTQMKNAKAAHQVSVRSFTEEMVNAKASMIDQPTAAAAAAPSPPVPPAAATSSSSSFSPLLAAGYSTPPRETNGSTTPVCPPLPTVRQMMRMDDSTPARLATVTTTTTTMAATGITPLFAMGTTRTTTSSGSSTIAPPLTGRRVVRARRPNAATRISLPVPSS
jgi:Zinc finger, C3HC4 type (RING finger)